MGRRRGRQGRAIGSRISPFLHLEHGKKTAKVGYAVGSAAASGKNARLNPVAEPDLVFQFQALDCETDATMVLLAAPSHSTKLHALTSRSLRRDQLIKTPAMAQMRTALKGVASRQHATRSRTATASTLERLRSSAGTAGAVSDTSSESREGDLTRALETALGSLATLWVIYEHRASRWEEMGRISDERERVELLLRQTLGASLQPNGVHVEF